MLARDNRIGITKKIPINGYPSIRQYLIAQELTPKGDNYKTAKKLLKKDMVCRGRIELPT